MLGGRVKSFSAFGYQGNTGLLKEFGTVFPLVYFTNHLKNPDVTSHLSGKFCAKSLGPGLG